MKNKYISDEIKEIYDNNKPTNYIINILFISLFIFVLVSLSFYVKYSKKIDGHVQIIPTINSFTLYAPSSGNLILLKNDRDTILQDEIIAYINNPTSFHDYNSLKLDLNNFNPKNLRQSINTFNYNYNYELGYLQEHYFNFILSINEYKNLLDNNIFEANIDKYTTIIDNKNKELSLLYEIKKIQSQKFLNIHDNYIKDSILNKKNIISKADFNNSTIQYLSYLENSLNHNIKVGNIKSNKSELYKEIQTLKIQNKNNTSQAIINVEKNYFNLINAIKNWEQSFIIKSPSRGRIQYISPFINNLAYIYRDTKLFFILPDSKNLKGKASVYPNGYGQLEVGQSAIIRINDYPYRDFGVIHAVVKNKSKIIQDSVYYVDVDLPNGLKTNTGKDLEYYYNMSGTIEFTTKKMSLIESILNIINSNYE